MNALLCNNRRFVKNAFRTSTFSNYNKYSTAHSRSHLAQKYRLDRGVVGPCFLRPQSHNQYAAVAALKHDNVQHTGATYYDTRRSFQLYHRLYDQPSSKVEVTVNTMKNKQKEKEAEIKKDNIMAATARTTTQTNGKCSGDETALLPKTASTAVVKKPLKTRIWEEIVHYYHGFRLLFVDINVCRKLCWRLLNGKTLTRRENKLLVRTTSDLFRLIPFSVFIIVPFMELLLPVFIKFFPGMLPSTFQTAKEREDKLKQSLTVRLEMAKFLQRTLDEMAVQHKEHKSEEAKNFDQFFKKIRDPNEYVSTAEIIKNAKSFEDEITLDSLSREQLVALCRVLELNTMGTTNFLRFNLRFKLRSLAADDREIARESVEALDLFELQQACKARGMRAYGLSVERLRSQLQEWIDLSLNEKVPPTLLLLSRAMLISDDTTTTDKLKETIRVLPEAVAAQTKAAIGEREGKIDNKTKIEVIKEEERKIREEREEEREEEKAKAEVLLDKAPVIDATTAATMTAATPLAAMKSASDTISKVLSSSAATTAANEAADKQKKDESISTKDVELISEALKTLSNDKHKMLVEKETIKDLKEELEDYKEDVQELHEMRTEVQEPVRESRAAKMLFKKVNSMIGNLDKVLADLEQKQHKKPVPTDNEATAAATEQLSADKQPELPAEDMVRIDELINTIKQFKNTSSESRLKTIENVLSKLDADKDGVITVDEVLKVVNAIGHENMMLDQQQIDELILLLEKEQIIEAEDRIEKAIAKSIKEANHIMESLKQDELDQQAADIALAAAKKASEEMEDLAPELKDNATNLDLLDKKNNLLSSEPKTTEPSILEAVEKQKEKILPKADISSTLPPQIPPPASTATQTTPAKDKMI